MPISRLAFDGATPRRDGRFTPLSAGGVAPGLRAHFGDPRGGRHHVGNDARVARTVSAVLANQRPDGSWDAERYPHDREFDNAYTTALVVFSLGAPNQFLPFFQR